MEHTRIRWGGGVGVANATTRMREGGGWRGTVWKGKLVKTSKIVGRRIVATLYVQCIYTHNTVPCWFKTRAKKIKKSFKKIIKSRENVTGANSKH